MLGLGLDRNLVDVRRDKREGEVRVLLVLGQVEADPADHVPNRVVLPEVPLDSVLEPRSFGGEGLAHVEPEVFEQWGPDQLRAPHGRRGLDKCRDLVGV